MVVYEYQCGSCDTRYTFLHKAPPPPGTMFSCEQQGCGGQLERKISAFAIGASSKADTRRAEETVHIPSVGTAVARPVAEGVVVHTGKGGVFTCAATLYAARLYRGHELN